MREKNWFDAFWPPPMPRMQPQFFLTSPDGFMPASTIASFTLRSESVWLASVSSIWSMLKLNSRGLNSKGGMKPPRLQ